METKKFVREARTAFKLTGESVAFAFSSLKHDKFRTFLSLLGVSIGIFSIVAVFSAVDALQANVREGLNSFGSDVAFIQQYPWGPEEGETEYKWWEYRTRPSIKKEDFDFIKNKLTNADHIAYISFSNKLFKNGRNSFSNGYIISSSPGLEKVLKIEIEEGRNFSLMEAAKGSNVAILGASVADVLFPDGNCVGNKFKIGNFSTTIIGKLKKQGQSIVTFFDFDNAVIVSLGYGAMMFNVDRDGMMVISPKSDVQTDDFVSEIKYKMRALRRLKPEQKDNFAINKMSFLSNSVESVFSVINLVGWVIGGFSLLIGGFGIANIMFVSVKERTNQIGIQKALGAKKHVIMTQFLVEASVLSLSGGMLGILIVYIVSLFLKNNPSFPLTLSLGNALSGLLIALIIGLVSGLIPAYIASKLDPVKAINS
jgi:putative ABC transport system permease protein